MKLMGVYLEITHFCNRSCGYCYNASDLRGNPMPYSVICDLLDDMEDHQVKSITISGGEPLSHPFCLDILRYCKSKSFNIYIITNCDYISNPFFELIFEYPIDLQITLDGYDEQTHDAVKGSANFRKVCQTLRILQMMQYRGSITCRVNLTKQNRSYLDKIAECAADLGVKRLLFSYINRVGRACNYLDGYDYEKDMNSLEDLRKELQAIRQLYLERMVVEYDDLVSSNGCPFNSLDEVTLYPRIAADGMVYPCQLFESEEFAIGNIFRGTLTDICSGEKLNEFIKKVHNRYQMLSTCEQCVWKRLCERGCPAKALNTYGSFFKESVTCQLQKRYYLSKVKAL